jgi:hypothetical protein
MGRPAKAEGTRARDVSPTGVRLAPNLRDALLRAAEINRRTLSAEITLRLAQSIAAERGPAAPAGHHVAEPLPASPMHPPALTDLQRQALATFDALAPDRQLALLALLRR